MVAVTYGVARVPAAEAAAKAERAERRAAQELVCAASWTR